MTIVIPPGSGRARGATGGPADDPNCVGGRIHTSGLVQRFSLSLEMGNSTAASAI